MSKSSFRGRIRHTLQRILRVIAWMAVPAGLGFLLWKVPQTEFFRLQRIEVQGVRFVSSDSLVTALRVEPGRSIFAPLDSLTMRASQVPGVASAVLRRRLPGTVVVTVIETVPVAWSHHGGRLVLVDEGARPLPFDPRGQRVRLPVAPADTTITRALGRILALDASWFGRLEQVAPGPGGTMDVLLPEGRVRLSGSPSPQVIPDLQVVMTDLAHRGDQWEYIDASYGTRFFVRIRARGRAPAPVDTIAYEEPEHEVPPEDLVEHADGVELPPPLEIRPPTDSR